MAAPGERWEYRAREVRLRDPVTRDLLLHALEAQCNDFGAEGWELAGVTPSEISKVGMLRVPSIHLVLIFKRPVPVPADPRAGC